MKIYTRAGDDGTTGLFYGGRVRKDDPAPMAYGDVDEAQAVLGVVRAELEKGSELEVLVVSLQRDMWVLMAELATAEENRHKLTAGTSLVTADMVARLEGLIDDITPRFPAITEFVVPGETRIGALLDVARTVIRRAERTAITASTPDSLVVGYLNRLSDLCWTLARWQDGTSLRARS
jgi:cob(I)alamin adenosyltransferase